MDVLMPQLGETVAEGKITRWFKTAGDAVAPGDNLFEIETDKVSMEIPATSAGVLAEIRVPAGEVVPVGAVVAIIRDGAGGSAPTNAAVDARVTQPRAGSETPPQPQASNGGEPAAAPIRLDPFFEVRTPVRNFGPARLPDGRRVTPLARRLAAQAGLELRHVATSSPRGRISAGDVETALRTAKATPAKPHVAEDRSADAVKALYREVPFREEPLDGMRRTIAARLMEAKQTIPHFYLTAEIGIERLLKLREQVNAAAPRAPSPTPGREGWGGKLSVNDFIIKGWAAALARVPRANAIWAGDRILRFTQCDIAVAVAIEGGLLTPVIRRVETKTLSAISREMKALAERARARKLAPNEYQGGVSTISNLGMHGVREFSAIINPPQASILAVGAARRQPVEREDGTLGFTSVLSVTLSCDHRVIDGVLGADLLSAFKGFIEEPVTMLV